VIPPGVAGPEVENAAVEVGAASRVAEPVVDVVAVVVVLAEVVFVDPFSTVHVSGPQVSGHIHTVFAVSIPVSVVMEEVDSFRRSIFFLFPNIDYHTSPSSFAEDADKESVGSPTDARAKHDLCSILSNQSLYHNRNTGYIYNRPNPDRNNESGTSALPMDATTSHPRRRCLHQCQVQRRHTYRVSLSPLVVRQIRRGVAEEY